MILGVVGVVGGTYFSGTLDDLRFYPSITMLRIGYGAGNRALSAADVTRLYGLGN